ncbi:MAG: TetR/AcrR family transcriptional regulator [Fusobacteriaceae bacterium]
MTRKEQAIITKKNIYNKALVLIKKNGFEQTSIKEISKSAGVTTGAFYYYYDSKIDLLLEIHHEIDNICLTNFDLIKIKNPEKK